MNLMLFSVCMILRVLISRRRVTTPCTSRAVTFGSFASDIILLFGRTLEQTTNYIGVALREVTTVYIAVLLRRYSERICMIHFVFTRES